MFQYAHQTLLKYLFFHMFQIISTFFYTYFMLFFEIMLGPQYNLVQNTDVQFMTKDAQWYFLVSTAAHKFKVDVYSHWMDCYIYKKCLNYFSI